jgi:S-DNA-T family DNA segregation ATPase FtsK/SpoIIIE
VRRFWRRDVAPSGFSRPPSDPTRAHHLAQRLAAERVDEPLDLDAARWLDGHLTGCADCAAIAAAYASDRSELRALREGPSPEPPRDLWARTSAALDAAGSVRARTKPGSGARKGRPSPWLRRLRPSPVPIAMLAGVMAIAVVVAGSFRILTSGPRSAANPPASAGSAAVASRIPTPLPVPPGNVAWVGPKEGGLYRINVSNVDHVCPADAQPDCAPITPGPVTGVQIPVQPSAIMVSPAGKGQAVVVARSGSGGGSIYSINVPSPQPSSPPGSSLSPTTSPSPTTSSTPATSSPSASESPSPASPTVTPSPTSSSGPGASPSGAPASSTPGASVPVSLPPGSASPSAGERAQPIISGVIVVGQSASYSPLGQWFAFTARPADGSHGPDIFLWRVGTPAAVAVTADHASVFSGWAGESLIGSRPRDVAAVVPGGAAPGASKVPGSSATSSAEPSESPSATPSPSSKTGNKTGASGRPSPTPAETAEASPGISPSAPATATPPVSSPSEVLDGVSDAVSFLVDPATSVQTALAMPAWRPVVDASGRLAVYWTGTVRRDPASGVWEPDQGRLVIGPWSSLTSRTPGDTSSPQPLPSSVVGTILGGSSTPDWDLRWDPSGNHLAAWIADGRDGSVGHLSLLTVDQPSGEIEDDRSLLAPTPALPGFAIADGRLAWATPPGQDGQGSSLQVLAWSGNDRGRVETTPLAGSDPVVVIR